MKPSHYIGVDCGHTGAIARISADGAVIEVSPMPVRERKTVKEVDTDALRLMLTPYLDASHTVVGIEWPSAWPSTFGNVARDAMVFGRGMGTVDATFTLMGFDVRRIPPANWKSSLALPGKTHDAKSVQATALWEKLYPAAKGLIRGARGGLNDGFLDSLLIAHYMRVGGEAPCGHKGGRRAPVWRGPATLPGMKTEVQEFWDDLTVDHK